MQNRLQQFLDLKQMSQRELAAAVGVSPQTINNIVKQRNTSGDIMLKIARHFGVDVEAIFFASDVKAVDRSVKAGRRNKSV